MWRASRTGLAIVGILCVGCTGGDSGSDAASSGAMAGSEPQPGFRIGVTARGGSVDGTTQGSDEFVWRLFAELVTPVAGQDLVLFETWASDADTFSTSPAWPSAGAPKRLQASRLGLATSHPQGDIDVKCSVPPNGAIGGFPTSGPPTPCIAEEVRRNRSQFDYIVNNGLNTKAGLAAAYDAPGEIAMPTDAVAVKVDWVPAQTVLQWLPQIGTIESLRDLYYTHIEAASGQEYAMVSMHVSSRQNPNWVWGSFEHQMTPGRCDDIGCFDSFGAQVAAVDPNQAQVDTQYGPCAKTAALEEILAAAGVAPVWQNYCMKSTQVDYATPDGTPTVLGNAVIERITGNGTVAASSCIACHVYASFGRDGAPTRAATAMLPYNPTGPPISAVLANAKKFDFMWGVLNAP